MSDLWLYTPEICDDDGKKENGKGKSVEGGRKMRLLDSEKVYKYIKETTLIPNHAKGAVYLDIEASSTYIVDAVERDCFDRVLRENDIMRQQLAEVGKKPGDAMSDVCKVDVVEAEYVGKDEICAREKARG